MRGGVRAFWAGVLALAAACDAPRAAPPDEAALAAARARMVREQIEARGIRDPRVLAALGTVPRHAFVDPGQLARAYDDGPLPIGHGQTISQPYIVAAMSELAEIGPGERVLEVGTGSGYQAAVLAELAGEVYSIEILAPLAAHAADTLKRLGYGRVHLRTGDGFRGWPEAAPFDAILVTAAPERVPPPLLEQLAPGGKLVIPVGESWQELEVHTKTASGIEVRKVFPVRFVPMTGEAGKPRRKRRASGARSEAKPSEVRCARRPGAASPNGRSPGLRGAQRGEAERRSQGPPRFLRGAGRAAGGA